MKKYDVDINLDDLIANFPMNEPKQQPKQKSKAEKFKVIANKVFYNVIFPAIIIVSMVAIANAEGIMDYIMEYFAI